MPLQTFSLRPIAVNFLIVSIGRLTFSNIWCFIAQAGLWFHRNGMPMGENEKEGHYMYPGQFVEMNAKDILTITNPDNRENSITAIFKSTGALK